MKIFKKVIILLTLIGIMILVSGCSIGETWDVLWGHNKTEDTGVTNTIETYDPNAITVDESVTAPVFNVDLEGSYTYAIDEPAKELKVEAAEEADGEVTYQWYVNGVDSNGGGQAVAGATTDTYIPDTSKEGRFYYFVVATHTVNKKMNLATSQIAEVIVDPTALPAEEAVNAEGWVETEDGWIYNDSEGVAQTGWIQDGDNWHYLGEDGIMKSGWIQDEGKWYCLDDKGMIVMGWVQEGDDWYYFDESGNMKTGFVDNGGKWYCFAEDGKLKKSAWTSYNKRYFYSTEDGSLAIGWTKIDGSYYYFSPEGVMRYDTEMEGKWLNPDGRLAE